MIELSYHSDGKQLLRAATLYLNHYLDSFAWRLTSWTCGIGTLFLLPYYWEAEHLSAYWVLAHLTSVILVFSRHRIFTLLIKRRMKRHPIHDKAIQLRLYDEGIVYKGEGEDLLDGEVKWHELSLVLGTANGYIFVLPCSRFVWLPLSAVSSLDTLHAIQHLLQEKHVRIEPHPEWNC